MLTALATLAAVAPCLHAQAGATTLQACTDAAIRIVVGRAVERSDDTTLGRTQVRFVVEQVLRGDPTPSRDDIRFTRDAIAAGELLGIDLIDHVVFGHGRGRWVSMRRQKLGFDAR